MATTPLHPSRLVVVESATGFASPRLMLAPAGARLPPGVHEVVNVAGPRGRLPRGARAVCCGGRDRVTAAGCIFHTCDGVPRQGVHGQRGHHVRLPREGHRTRRILRGTRGHVVAVSAAGAGFGGRVTRSSRGAASTGFGRFAAASTGSSSRRALSGYVTRALDLGDDGGGEEDPSDELSYQRAQREMQAAVYLVCLNRRVQVASDLGLIPSGHERILLLEELGDIDPAAPMYHWVITRRHSRLKHVLGLEVYQEIITATPKDDVEFSWIVETESGIIVSITTLMAEIKYSIMHSESWRAVVRDHPLYDICPLFLNKLAASAAEFSTNLDLACFKRPFPPIIQRMAENHALAVVHLYEILLDFYEVLSGEQAEHPKKTKDLLMRYDFLFVQDLDPLDYISGIGAADTKELLSLLKLMTPEVRTFRGTWM